jgi:hypothetical protein
MIKKLVVIISAMVDLSIDKEDHTYEVLLVPKQI